MDPTSRVPLGETPLTVTRLGLGSAPLGGLRTPVSDEAANAVVQRAYDVGLRLYDTAPLYGYGMAEQRLGRVLRNVPRDEIVLATKVGRLIRPREEAARGLDAGGASQFVGAPPLVPVFDFSYDAIMRSLEESLERLGMDRVDILHIHDPDDYHEQAVSDAYRALDKLRNEGVIRAVGAGMNFAAPLARFAREADFDCFLVAGRYTLLDQAALPELLPICEQKNIAIIIGGVYNSGILANLGDPERETFNYQPAERQWLEKARKIDAVCQRHGVPIQAAALQFPLAHPAVATVLTGARSVAELDQNVAFMQHPIPAALWQELKAEGLLPEEAPVPAGAA
ncbi:MAG: aldo/keto reductase [Chloroflexi bacterium]|nr:aldo/keto reductase [Chloroflexota bacterium]